MLTRPISSTFTGDQVLQVSHFKAEMGNAVDATVKGEIVGKILHAVEGRGGWKERVLRLLMN